MSPRIRRKNTKKRVKKHTKRRAFWNYIGIILVAVLVGCLTYFGLDKFYKHAEHGNKATIEKIDEYLHKQKQANATKQSKQQEKQAKEQSVKSKSANQTKPKTQDKLEPKIKPEQNVSKEQNLTLKNSVKEIIKDINLTQKDQNLSSKTKIGDINLSLEPTAQSKPNGKIQITVTEQNLSKKNKQKSEKKQEKYYGYKSLAADGTKPQSGKPKLVIIIDDVAYKHQVDAIKSINLKLTPSIFPPTRDHPDTPALARRFKFYMIHLPMQAKSQKGAEIGTLNVNDSYEKISKKIRDIKRDFPNLKYINNHTGSKFTSDFEAMDRLMGVLKSENLMFLDSKTIANTKVAYAAKKHSMPYISRDVFLDHEDDKSSIRKQLRYAVQVAKKKTRAIAIGHPHKNTLDVLRDSQDILKDVEVVYLKDIL